MPPADPHTPATPAPSRWWAWQARNAPYLFVLPFVILFCAFMVYPLTRSILLSFQKSAGPREMQWVGLSNYAFLLQDRLFWIAVKNTVLYTVLFLSIQLPSALGLALLVNSQRLRYRNLFRYALFSTHLVGGVFVAVLFSRILRPGTGPLNQALGSLADAVGLAALGVELRELNWLARPELALPAVLLAALWLSIGYAMIYFLAALQSVDQELYEAAEVDGAGPWAKFWHVTLPGIRPTLIFMLLVGTIGAFQLFELPYVLFQGPGPDNAGLTIVMYLFQQGFETGDIGYASAIGWLLVLMILAVSIAQVRVTRAAQES